jgi:hypothetical protein
MLEAWGGDPKSHIGAASRASSTGKLDAGRTCRYFDFLKPRFREALLLTAQRSTSHIVGIATLNMQNDISFAGPFDLVAQHDGFGDFAHGLSSLAALALQG